VKENRIWIYPPLNGEKRNYLARSDGLHQNLWTDPWDGKQKVMERQQHSPRAPEVLPPGVAVGTDGKWSFSPPAADRVAADLEDKAREGVRKAGALVPWKRAIKVGSIVYLTGPGPWKGGIGVVTELGVCCHTVTPLNLVDTDLDQKLRDFALGRANTYAFTPAQCELVVEGAA